MIFKRRHKLPIATRLRDFISPRKGWRRGFRYIGKRVQRLPDTPHRIALGFACGSMASFSPFFTLHFFVAALYAWIVRGNIIAAAFGTIVGNPITFALIAATCMAVGNWMLGLNGDPDYADKLSVSFAIEHPWQFLEAIFTPYLIGGIIPGLVFSTMCYFLIRPIVARFQKQRRDLLSTRARARIAERTGGAILSSASVGGAGGGQSAPRLSRGDGGGARSSSSSVERSAASETDRFGPAPVDPPHAPTNWPQRKAG